MPAGNQPSIESRSATKRSLHRRRLALVGALIVLATFFVKEELRDRLRSLTDSIRQAQTLAATRMDTVAALRATRYIADLIQDLELEIPKDDSRTLDNFHRVTDLAIMSIEQDRLGISLESLKQIMDSLPRDEHLDQMYKNVSNQIQITSQSVGETDVMSATLSTALLASVVLDRAQKMRATYERWYRISGWVSYLLFGAGWVVALVGKLDGDGQDRGE